MLNRHTGLVATILNDLAIGNSKHFKQGNNTTSLCHCAGSLKGELKIGGRILLRGLGSSPFGDENWN